MLAYVFWHAPKPEAQLATYEQGLLAFSNALLRSGCEGLRSIGQFRISAVPWLDYRDGYEDWVIVDGPAVLGDLNTVAVSGPMAAPHARVAQMMEVGYGGLYYHLWGTLDAHLADEAQWLSRPRGIDFRPALEEMTQSAEQAVSVWRRLMVLGPGSEFLVLATRPFALLVPEGWKGHRVQRTALGGAVAHVPKHQQT